MTKEFNRDPAEDEVRTALQEALSDRFDGVDWEALYGRIVADALSHDATARRPAEVLAAWSVRGAAAAGALLAASIAALLFVSVTADADPEPLGFWPVAEELIAGVPAETRQLLEAGADVDGLLRLLAASGEEIESR